MKAVLYCKICICLGRVRTRHTGSWFISIGLNVNKMCECVEMRLISSAWCGVARHESCSMRWPSWCFKVESCHFNLSVELYLSSRLYFPYPNWQLADHNGFPQLCTIMHWRIGLFIIFRFKKQVTVLLLFAVLFCMKWWRHFNRQMSNSMLKKASSIVKGFINRIRCFLFSTPKYFSYWCWCILAGLDLVSLFRLYF